MALDILIIDDEADIRDLISGVLEDEGYETRTAADSDEALAALRSRRPSLLILDIWLEPSRLDGLEILQLVKKRDPSLPIIIISGHGNIETAVAAIKHGAHDFIEKPFQSERLLLAVQRATEAEKLRRENVELKTRAGMETELHGSSGAIATVRATIKRVAATSSRVLIHGPAGSGKEIAARLLHAQSEQGTGPFIVVSAARMTPERVEEELFGVEENGEVVRPGLFEQAHGGTLFLDEVSDMPLATQGRVLRALTEQAFQRVGGTQDVRVAARIISATTRDLTREIAQGRFREDLYYRLAVVPIDMPFLRDRRGDIPGLAQYFLARLVSERGGNLPQITDGALAALQAYDWPGNIRQLRNVIERTLILMPPDKQDDIDVAMLPPEITGMMDEETSGGGMRAVIGAPLREAREGFEREYLRMQLQRFSGNVSRTASFIGMERSALHRKIKALGLTENGENDA